MKHSPLKQTERITIIDALRGFALLGILMVNMPFMYEPMSRMALGANPDASVIQIIAESFIKFFFEGKFYVIFSMLFGFGFYIFLNKSNSNGNSSLPIFLRRLFYLLLFGVAHICLLWSGDVLLLYSFYGFILILFRKVSDKKVISWAVALALIPSFILLLGSAVAMFSQSPEFKTVIEASMQESLVVMNGLVERATQIYSSESFREIVSVRIEEYLNSPLFYSSPTILAMFLVGLLLARRGILKNYMNNDLLFQKIFWWGLAVGVITNILYLISYRYAVMNVLDGWILLVILTQAIGGISLGLCYVSGIAILFIKGKTVLFTKYLVPVGRMALTNYLLQSVTSVLLFHSYGFALYGKVEVWKGIVLTLTIFALQIVFSRWWLNRFQFGPFEWLWRSLTYFKLQPMRK